jgi:drug/metabolite transporter (DMT)-like permease
VAQLALLAPLALATGTPLALPTAPLDLSDAVLVAQVAIACALYPLFFALQARADAVALSQIGYVTVAVGVLWGALLYGESLSPWMGASVVLLFAGLHLVQSAARAAPAPPAAADAARPSH